MSASSGPQEQSEVIIRKAESSDLPALVEMMGHLDLPGEVTCTLDKAESVFARTQRYPDYTIFLAEMAGRCVGTFALITVDELAHGASLLALVEDVVVAPEHRGLGLGKKMMSFAMEQAREKGCYKLMLSSNLSREDAHRFYESLGFEVHGYSYKVTL